MSEVNAPRTIPSWVLWHGAVRLSWRTDCFGRVGPLLITWVAGWHHFRTPHPQHWHPGFFNEAYPGKVGATDG